MDAPAQPPPLDAAAALGWMRANPGRLRELVRQEAAGDADPPPAGDAAIRANLRLAAEAIEAVAAPVLAPRVAGLADGLPDWFAEHQEAFDRHMALGAGAIALEAHLQFGVTPGTDPSVDAALDRRVRLAGWTRLFLLGLEERLGPQADGVADAALARLGERSRDLARLIVALDRSSRAALAERLGREVDDPATLDRLGQAAAVQAQVRIAVEAAADTLAAP